MQSLAARLSDLSTYLMQSGSIESLALLLWGCCLIGIGAVVRALISPAPALRAPRASDVHYPSDRRSLTESRA
jgi:hypothetical protein